MEREAMRETIKKNREALGMDADDELLINMLVIGNKIISLQGVQQDNNIILADGLMIGYEA